MMMFNRHPRLRFFALSLSLASLSACNMLQPQSADNGLPDPDYQLDSEQRAHLEDKIVEEVSKVPEFEYEDIWARIRNGSCACVICIAQGNATDNRCAYAQAYTDGPTVALSLALRHVASGVQTPDAPLLLTLLSIMGGSCAPFDYSRAKAAR